MLDQFIVVESVVLDGHLPGPDADVISTLHFITASLLVKQGD